MVYCAYRMSFLSYLFYLNITGSFIWFANWFFFYTMTVPFYMYKFTDFEYVKSEQYYV